MSKENSGSSNRPLRLTLDVYLVGYAILAVPEFDAKRARVVSVIDKLLLKNSYRVPEEKVDIWIDLITIRYSQVELPNNLSSIFIEDAAAAIWLVLGLLK